MEAEGREFQNWGLLTPKLGTWYVGAGEWLVKCCTSQGGPWLGDRCESRNVSRCSSELRGPASAARWEAPVLACWPRARRRGPGDATGEGSSRLCDRRRTRKQKLRGPPHSGRKTGALASSVALSRNRGTLWPTGTSASVLLTLMRRLASVVGGFVPGHLCAEASVEGQTPASLQSWGPCLTPLSTGDQATGKKMSRSFLRRSDAGGA